MKNLKGGISMKNKFLRMFIIQERELVNNLLHEIILSGKETLVKHFYEYMRKKRLKNLSISSLIDIDKDILKEIETLENELKKNANKTMNIPYISIGLFNQQYNLAYAYMSLSHEYSNYKLKKKIKRLKCCHEFNTLVQQLKLKQSNKPDLRLASTNLTCRGTTLKFDAAKREILSQPNSDAILNYNLSKKVQDLQTTDFKHI